MAATTATAPAIADVKPSVLIDAPLLSAEANPRGIPKALFVADVEDLVKKQGTPEELLALLQDYFSKYRMTESQKRQQRSTLVGKIPEIEKALAAVLFLKGKSAADTAVTTQFELSDGIFANAEIKKPKAVGIWLGANVMVEYSFEEAIDLLQKNLTTAKKTLKEIEEDIDFVKEQITVVEVNMARIYNHDVKIRRRLKATAQGSEKE